MSKKDNHKLKTYRVLVELQLYEDGDATGAEILREMSEEDRRAALAGAEVAQETYLGVNRP